MPLSRRIVMPWFIWAICIRMGLELTRTRRLRGSFWSRLLSSRMLLLCICCGSREQLLTGAYFSSNCRMNFSHRPRKLIWSKSCQSSALNSKADDLWYYLISSFPTPHLKKFKQKSSLIRSFWAPPLQNHPGSTSRTAGSGCWRQHLPPFWRFTNSPGIAPSWDVCFCCLAQLCAAWRSRRRTWWLLLESPGWPVLPRGWLLIRFRMGSL